ncbi:4-oxalocrotonate tautomerase [Marinilactibacillus piezotolerans]|uniref:4-oxalocrotonate tautomerase n=1 Tax=Marinilactibacillus piezotolerans TaxID=258723 RepID=A0A1I4A2S3_9LACT|nr:2-hydroxymuconate tautomerase [Marinilactibacillus piezotolerans]SFK50231.1 4-oxalocrotonate tautomerase [Marinilactibacillus piezotolerans]
MPIVHVDMIKGRTDEQKKGLVEDIVKAVETHTGASKDAITVIINDIEKNNIATKGQYQG